MDAALTGPGQDLFIQVFSPPLRLFVIGAVHIAQSLIPMAELIGYQVVLIDPRKAWASNSRFPKIDLRHLWPDEALAALAPDRRSALVALTHDPKLDDPALDAALKSDCFYIGALGSRRSHAARLARLKALGHSDRILARIHGPIGLDIGAKSPAEIAAAILAELIQVRRKGAAAPQGR
jgi:xanthine dehydrogenase accessory factor